MADATTSVRENVSGDFFVDSSCIDCDTCRQVAPLVFAQADGHASSIAGIVRLFREDLLMYM